MPMIDKEFPHIELFPLAEAESWRKEVHRPIYYGHKWWARRLGTVFRYIVGSSISERFTFEEYYNNSDSNKSKVVLDPFMGSGTTIGESLKLGCKTIGSDINPVSYFMVKTSLQNIDLKQLTKHFNDVRSDVLDKVNKYYKTTNPKTGKDCEVLYFFWVATLPCNNCNKSVPLFNSYIFSKNAYPTKVTKCQIVCPKCLNVDESNYLESEHKCSACKLVFNQHEGNAQRTSFQCYSCKSISNTSSTVKKIGKVWDYTLYAIMFIDEDGNKQYKATDEKDQKLFVEVTSELGKIKDPLMPLDTIFKGNNTNQILAYNFNNWSQLFNSRQLFTLHYLLKSILITPQPYRDVFLMLFSGLLEFNNMFCSFKGEGTGAVRHIFSHHILKPEKMALENIVIGNGKSSGTFTNLFKTRIVRLYEYLENPFEIKVDDKKTEKVSLGEKVTIKQTNSFADLSKNGNLLLFCKDSSSLPIPDKTVDAVVTDPPFFDYINYSELADFFYSWIRLAKQDDPIYLHASTRSENDVQNNSHQKFSEKLSDVFKECHRVLKDNGLMIFTFHHSTDDGWGAIKKSLKDSRFVVIKTYPIKSEMSVSATQSNNSKPINIDAIIVCQKTETATQRKVNVEKEVQDLISQYAKYGYKLGNGDTYVLKAMKELEGTS